METSEDKTTDDLATGQAIRGGTWVVASGQGNPCAGTERDISGALAAVIVTAVLGVILGTASLAASYPEGVAAFPGATLMFILAYGISKKSRFCAVVAFVVFLASVFELLSTGPESILGVILMSVLAYWSFRGVVGTFRYRRIARTMGVSGRPAWLLVGIGLGTLLLLIVTAVTILVQSLLMSH